MSRPSAWLVGALAISGATIAGVAAIWGQLGALAVVTVGCGVVWLSRRRPAVPIAVVALVVPTAHFFPPLRLQLPSGYLTVFQAAGLAIGLTVAATSARRKWPLSTLKFAGAITLALGVAAATGRTPSQSWYWVLNAGVLLAALTIAIGSRSADSQGTVHNVVARLGAVVGGIAVTEAMLGRAILQEHFVRHIDPYTAGGAGFRPPTLIGNPLVSSSALVVIYALVLSSSHVKHRSIVLSLIGSGVIASLSRSSIAILLVLTMIYFVAPSRQSHVRRARLLLLVLAPGLIAGVALVSPRIIVRTESGVSDNARRLNLIDAIELVGESPLVGIGPGGFKELASDESGVDRPATIDNMYLTMVTETGLLGVAIVAIGMVAWLRDARRCAPRGNAQVRQWLPLIAFGLVSLFFETLYHDAMLFLFSVVLLDRVQPLSRQLDSAFANTAGIEPKSTFGQLTSRSQHRTARPALDLSQRVREGLGSPARSG